ncbi:MAG: glycosyltransferase family 4 protein, partial [Cyanobacteriota bacterium]|nr:glycosyltransferase family 4 protein [Cyanobacteriota bacterium]
SANGAARPPMADRKRLLVLCPYPFDTAPSQRLKYEQYLPWLRCQGYAIEIHSFFSPATYAILYRQGHLARKILGVLAGFWRRVALLPRVHAADGVYIHLHVAPLGPPWLEWLTCRLARAVIYDIDDMVHLLPTSRANAAAGWLKSNGRYFLLMRQADHVITCTPALDRLVRQVNPHTTDISSTINTDTYQPVNPYTNAKELVLGWSGSHSTAPYLHLLDGVLRQLARRHRFRLLVMGPERFELPGVSVEVIPWSTEVELPTLQRMDIGLYPLPDDPWVQGKSGLKALQYMALGVPVVATAAGCNDRVVADGVTGYLVSSEADWLAGLERLLTDPDLRRRLGHAGRARVEASYSLRANRDRYLAILQATVGQPSPPASRGPLPAP